MQLEGVKSLTKIKINNIHSSPIIYLASNLSRKAVRWVKHDIPFINAYYVKSPCFFNMFRNGFPDYLLHVFQGIEGRLTNL